MILSLFRNIRRKAKDMKTIAALCKGAEKYSRQENETKPGVEHFVLAAMELDDKSAHRVMRQFKVDISELQKAIQKQHQQALQQIGIEEENFVAEGPSTEQKQRALYQAQPSGQELIKRLHQNNNSRTTALAGVHVLEAALLFEYGTLVGAFDELRVDPNQLKLAIENELSTS